MGPYRLCHKLRLEKDVTVDDSAIGSVPLFAALDDDARVALREAMGEVSLRRGETLFHEGEPGDRLYLVLEGKVKLGHRSADGRENLLAILGPGELLGELTLFDPGTRTATATAVASTRLLELQHDPFMHLVDTRPELAKHMLRALAQRLRRTNEALADLVFSDVPGRVAKALLELGVGEALVSTLDEKGIPTPVQKALIAPPRCRMGAITPEERHTIKLRSPVGAKYDTAVDRESAFELLAKKAEGLAAQAGAPQARTAKPMLLGTHWLAITGKPLAAAAGALKHTIPGDFNLARADGTVLQVYRQDPADPATLPDNTVYALAVDAGGDVWVATGGGLARIKDPRAAPDTIEFQVYSSEDGLSSDTLWGVVPDAAGHLWLSSNTGLMRLNPETGAVKSYHRYHGLQGEEFSFGAYFRLRDGRLSFGGPGGFNIFDPAALSVNTEPPRVTLMNVDVLGVRAGGATPFWLRDRVELDYRGSIVSLDFGLLDFTSPAHNRLAYRIAGLTDDWIDLGAERRITLTNLDPGDHVLEVRAANSDSGWSRPLSLTIHRDPAPWASPLAYIVYALVLLGLLAHRIHRHREKFREVVRARERLEAEVQLRTRELRESNQQLAEAVEAKGNFLDRMSHELRTPMNGVVGMTELLSRTTLSPTQTHLTKTIRSSAQVLLQIVNDLLDLSKIRAGKIGLEALPIDLGQVLEECTSLFAGAAEAKGIELVVCPPERAERTLLGDPLRIRQVLMNLVGNAVKFTRQGEVFVKAEIESIEAERALVNLSVRDTGIGMDAAAVSRVFEPFVQGDESTTRNFGGTGLGLAICRELAEVMGGRLAVESQPQIGSSFCLSLPLALGPAAERQPARLAGSVRILSRRPSVAESLARHASSLGLTVAADDAHAADIVVVDAGSHAGTLQALLGPSGSTRTDVVAIATAAEADACKLGARLPEERIVLKPVHRVALYEALAAALHMPVAADAKPAPEETIAPLRGHVLLVEDEPVNAAVAEGYLAALGCTSVWVKGGTEAVARAAAERFDLIMMDLNMPGMDGFTASKLIRQQQRGGGQRVPIVALTAHDAAHYHEKCLAADIDDILSKPYTLEDCASLLRRWLQVTDDVPVAAVREARACGGETAGDSNAAPATLASVDANTVTALRHLPPGRQVDLYSRLVELFRSSSAQSLAELEAALEQDDLAAAAAVCHKMASAAGRHGMNDYRHIRRWSTKTPGKRKRIRPADTIAAHRVTRAFIDEAMTEPHAGPTVVVTHHAPHPRSLDGFYKGDLDWCYASDMGLTMEGETAPGLWLHGHIHRAQDYQVGSTRVVSNPRGYRFTSHEQNNGFDPALVINLDEPRPRPPGV